MRSVAKHDARTAGNAGGGGDKSSGDSYCCVVGNARGLSFSQYKMSATQVERNGLMSDHARLQRSIQSDNVSSGYSTKQQQQLQQQHTHMMHPQHGTSHTVGHQMQQGMSGWAQGIAQGGSRASRLPRIQPLLSSPHSAGAGVSNADSTDYADVAGAAGQQEMHDFCGTQPFRCLSYAAGDEVPTQECVMHSEPVARTNVGGSWSSMRLSAAEAGETYGADCLETSMHGGEMRGHGRQECTSRPPDAFQRRPHQPTSLNPAIATTSHLDSGPQVSDMRAFALHDLGADEYQAGPAHPGDEALHTLARGARVWSEEEDAASGKHAGLRSSASTSRALSSPTSPSSASNRQPPATYTDGRSGIAACSAMPPSSPPRPRGNSPLARGRSSSLASSCTAACAAASPSSPVAIAVPPNKQTRCATAPTNMRPLQAGSQGGGTGAPSAHADMAEGASVADVGRASPSSLSSKLPCICVATGRHHLCRACCMWHVHVHLPSDVMLSDAGKLPDARTWLPCTSVVPTCLSVQVQGMRS